MEPAIQIMRSFSQKFYDSTQQKNKFAAGNQTHTLGNEQHIMEP
jgi:hypothetical protein